MSTNYPYLCPQSLIGPYYTWMCGYTQNTPLHIHWKALMDPFPELHQHLKKPGEDCWVIASPSHTRLFLLLSAMLSSFPVLHLAPVSTTLLLTVAHSGRHDFLTRGTSGRHHTNSSSDVGKKTVGSAPGQHKEPILDKPPRICNRPRE